MRYEESWINRRAKRAGRVAATVTVLGFAFVSGTLHGRARFGDGGGSPGTSVAESFVPGSSADLLLADRAGAAEVAWDLPNIDHPRVDYFTNMFTTRKRDDFELYMERSGKYVPMISAKLEERGMPQDLIYLAMIESGFNPQAYSPAAASGLWQFIGETGQHYGLEINRAVDERNDPEKATDAALTYLEELYDRFGSWYLAAAAYNTGENRVARIMREETGSEKGDEDSYFLIRDRLPKETRDYVPLMIAAARIAKTPAEYGFDEVELAEPLTFDEVIVGPSSSLEAIADAAETTVAEIKRLNPQLKLSRTRNDESSTIRIPSGSADQFAVAWPAASARQAALAKAEAASKPSPRTAAATTYRVRRGDNLTVIARRHGTTVAALRRENQMTGSRIRAGDILRIPRTG